MAQASEVHGIQSAEQYDTVINGPMTQSDHWAGGEDVSQSPPWQEHCEVRGPDSHQDCHGRHPPVPQPGGDPSVPETLLLDNIPAGQLVRNTVLSGVYRFSL